MVVQTSSVLINDPIESVLKNKLQQSISRDVDPVKFVKSSRILRSHRLRYAQETIEQIREARESRRQPSARTFPSDNQNQKERNRFLGNLYSSDSSFSMIHNIDTI